MRTINMTFSEAEFKIIQKEKEKANLSWERFFLSLINNGYNLGQKTSKRT